MPGRGPGRLHQRVKNNLATSASTRSPASPALEVVRGGAALRAAGDSGTPGEGAGFADARRPAFLLVDSGFCGTLAAARSLGDARIPVHVASDKVLGLSRWSRHVAASPRCPPMAATGAFIEWLLAFGAQRPGTVLYPTSDDAAYVYGLHLNELSRVFRTYQPAGDALMRVLDKRLLSAKARELGIDVPDTWFPQSEAEVARIARDAEFPVVVKPRTQVLSSTHGKGAVVTRRDELTRVFRREARHTVYGRELVDRYPEAVQFMVQAHFAEAAAGIYELSAFVDRSGTLFAARAARKVLQRPRSLGVGLCFEDAPLDPELAEASRRLAVACGYFGVMQLEFIEVRGRRLLIDFNPRFYNQLAFDVARSLPLPRMVYAAARNEHAELADLVDLAKRSGHNDHLVFCNRVGLAIVLSSQWIAGQIGAMEVGRWRRWLASHHGDVVDASSAPGDVVPALVDAVSQVAACARHPRSFLKQVVLGR